MQNFKVSNNDFSFKSSTHGFKLVFCGSTFIRKTELPYILVNFLNIIGLDTIVDEKFQSNLLVGTFIHIFILPYFVDSLDV